MVCQSSTVSVGEKRAYLNSESLPGTKAIDREKEMHCHLVEYKISFKVVQDFGMEVCVIGWVASRATASYY